MINLVFSTFNGELTLRLMLPALVGLQPPVGGWKLIAVNNASTDNTLELLKSYQDKLPLIILQETTPGKNYALNSAVGVLDGDLIVFTDDDVIPEPAWLLNLEKAATEHPEFNVFAGQIRHHWMKKPPHWLEKMGEDGRAYAGTPITMARGSIAARAIKGANFMIRKPLLDKHRFREDIGPNGEKNYTGGSETEFLIRLENDGNKMLYIPQSCVKHIVKREQVSTLAVIRRYLRIGKGMQSNTGKNPIPPDVASLFGYPRYALKEVLTSLVGSLKFLIQIDTYRCMNKVLDATVRFGMAEEWRKQHASKKQP